MFCGIAAGRVEARVVAETDLSVAFMDAFPLAEGHSLVIPKAHYGRVQDVPPAESADLFETVRRLIGRVDELGGSTLLAVHNGPESGQEVPHVHVHLIPRSGGDGAGPVHSMFPKESRPSGGAAPDAYRVLRGGPQSG